MWNTESTHRFLSVQRNWITDNMALLFIKTKVGCHFYYRIMRYGINGGDQ